MEHLNVFTNFFSKNLATFLDPSFLWGALGCLLQVGRLVFSGLLQTKMMSYWLTWLKVVIESEDLHMLSEIPRMIKHLVNQAEAFNGFCSAMSEVGNLTKEACFDMQLLYLDFYVSAIRCIHDPGEMQYGTFPTSHAFAPLTFVIRWQQLHPACWKTVYINRTRSQGSTQEDQEAYPESTLSDSTIAKNGRG